MRILTTAFAILILTAGCGGGSGSGSLGGGNSGGIVNPGTDSPADRELSAIRTETGASAPEEGVTDQNSRSGGIVTRARSNIGSGSGILRMTRMHANRQRTGATFDADTECNGLACTITYPDRSTEMIDIDDLAFQPASAEAVGTKNGITLIRDSVGPDNDGFSMRVLGAWMEHGNIVVQIAGFGVDDDYIWARVAWAGGALSGSRPTGTGTATWNGLMVGTPAIGRRTGHGDRLQGDAALTYDMSAQTLDASFTNIRNIDELRAHTTPTVSFTGVMVNREGTFEQATADADYIQGGFLGPAHEEAAGVFEKSGIIGAFGARKP